VTFDDGYRNNLTVVAPLLQAWNLPFTVFISTRHIDEHLWFPTFYMRAAAWYAPGPVASLDSLGQTFPLASRADRKAFLTALTTTAKKAPLRVASRLISECMTLLPADRWSELRARFSSEEPMNWKEVRQLQALGATIGSHCHDHCILHADQLEADVSYQLAESKRLIERHVGECRYFAFPNGRAEDISPFAYETAKIYRMCFTIIEGEVTPQADTHWMPRVFAQPDYEEFRYELSRTGRQNVNYLASRHAMVASRISGSPSIF
jgi:hypothetical protein